MRRVCVYLTLFSAFLLGSHRGFLALWINGDVEPVQVFPYSVASLPPADQQSLEKGIRIDSREELAAILEDYLS
jgi:hypothetical protein